MHSIDAVYCGRKSSVVSPRVCLLVTLVSRAKMDELIESRNAFVGDSGGPKEPCILY